jgi:hypothetical protein
MKLASLLFVLLTLLIPAGLSAQSGQERARALGRLQCPSRHGRRHVRGDPGRIRRERGTAFHQ